jgi:NAD(P)-dependent dehydrogenase (short-subunit alcohol dehydrogenase family)
MAPAGSCRARAAGSVKNRQAMFRSAAGSREKSVSSAAAIGFQASTSYLASQTSAGVGLATAEVLARAGHTVLLGARDPGRGEAAAAALAAQGLTTRFVRLDVTDPATIAAAARLIEAGYGRLDVLINNAGISRDRPHQPGDVPVEAIREVYETNVIGVIAVTSAMLPLLRRSAAGYLGNVSSGLGSIALLTDHDSDWAAYANLLGYNSSKAALNAVT